MHRIKRAALTAITTLVAALIPWKLLHTMHQITLLNEQELADRPDNPLRDAADRRLFPYGSH